MAKTRRSKCFTGCWTCRLRRVKCDEKTPACQRCQQLGVHCEGYGIRLHWMQWNPQDETNEPESPKLGGTRPSRRSLAWLGAAETAAPRLSSPELDLSLREIDGWRPDADGESSSVLLENGYFSVFSVASLPPEPRQPAHRRIHRSTSTAANSAIEPEQDVIPVAHENHLAPERPDQEEDATIAFPVAQALLRLGQDSHLDGLEESRPASARCELEAERARSTDRQHRRHPTPPRYLDSLRMPVKQRRLIHHWVTFTSRKIVLVDEPHNPCRTMMLPMALKGLSSRADDSNADMAIFHALCASAAYNLYELGGQGVEEDRVLALDHEQQAIQHLRHDLARADQHRDQSSAMAIMACITVEAVSGTTQRWRTHVAGGLGYLAQLQAQGVDEAVISAFRNHMVKMAILSGFTVPEDLKSFLYGDADAALEFTFPYYGVSMSFLRALDRTNMLAEAEEVPMASREIDALELQLYLGFPSGIHRQPSSVLSPKLHDVIHHTAVAFYYAGLVFFQRRIRHAPVADVQDLVELGVRELQSVERVGGGELGCMMMWPALVLGAECHGPELQQHMQSWFRAQQRLGFRNLVVLEDLVTTIWKARESQRDAELFSHGSGNSSDWWNVMAQARFDIFRL